MEKTVYISGALTNSEKKELYEMIGNELEIAGFSAYIPHQHTDPIKNADITPVEVYRTDMNMIARSCLVVAYVGAPSLGVGAELERANALGIPIIIIYEKGKKVSRLIKGIPMVKEIMEYDSIEKLLGWIPYMICHVKNM